MGTPVGSARGAATKSAASRGTSSQGTRSNVHGALRISSGFVDCHPGQHQVPTCPGVSTYSGVPLPEVTMAETIGVVSDTRMVISTAAVTGTTASGRKCTDHKRRL